MERISKGRMGVYSMLSRKKFREKEGLFIVEGEKCVGDALKSGFELEALVASETWYSAGRVSEGVSSSKRYVATEGELKKISSLVSAPPVVAVFRLPERGEAPAPERGKLSLVLDGVQDPGNLGSIVRSADWFGVRRIYASSDTVDIFNPKALMATMGSLARVEVYYCDVRELIRKAEMPVYGTLLNGENIYDAELGGSGLIVMGNEGNGLSPEVRGLVSSPLLIPPVDPAAHAESLNVGVATAVVLAEFARRMRYL